MAVVGHMRVGHQQIPVVDPRDAVFFVGSTIDGHAFAELIVVADFHRRVTIVISLVLRLRSDDAAGPEAIIAADRGTTGDTDMTVELAAVTDDDVWPDDTEGANRHVVANASARGNVRQKRNTGGHGNVLVAESGNA